MPLSTFTQVPTIAEGSAATPGLWNYPFSVLSQNMDQLNAQAGAGTLPSSVVTGGLLAGKNTSAYSFVAWSGASQIVQSTGANAFPIVTNTPVFSAITVGTLTFSNTIAYANLPTNVAGGTWANGGALAITGGAVTVEGLTTTGTVTLTGATVTGAPTWGSTQTLNTSGNAATATAWATGRTLSITGDLAYTSPSLDGSGNVTAAGTLATVATAGTTGASTAIPVITINDKGLTTSITTAAVVAPAGTLTGTTLASNVVTSSLTTIGTLVAGAVPASLVTAGTFPAGAFSIPTLAVTSGLTLTGATITGTPTWSSSQAITLSTAAQPNVTSLGTLTGLSTGAITTTGLLTGTTGYFNVGAGEVTVSASASDPEGIALQAAYSNDQSSGRLFFREASGSLYGMSLIYAGADNPTIGGQAFTLGQNFLYIQRHENSAAGSTVLSIARASGAISVAGTVALTAAGTGLAVTNNTTIGGALGIGVDDSSAGILRVYGGAAATDEGGELQLYPGADHDGTINYFAIDAYQDDLRMSTSGGAIFFKYSGGTDDVTFNGKTVTAGKLLVNGTGPDLTTGDILAQNGVFAISDASVSNIDHIWHDDATNTWHLVSDAARKATGNSGLHIGPLAASTGTFTGLVTANAGLAVNGGALAVNAVITSAQTCSIAGSLTASGNLARGVVVSTALIASANGDQLDDVRLQATRTPGAFTALSATRLKIDAMSVATFTSPADPIMISVGALTGTGATNAYAVKLGAGPSGATNNYLIHATNFTLTSAGAGTFSGLVTANAGLTVASGQTLTLTGATVTGAPTWNQSTTGSAATLTTPRAINGVNFDGSAAITVAAAAGTLTGATLAAGVTASSLTQVGVVTSGSIGMGFGNINNAGNTLTTGALTAASGTFTAAITSGINDTSLGEIYAYGRETGWNEGGRFRAYTAADHDTTIDYFEIDAYQDDFRILSSVTGGTVLFRYNGGTNDFTFNNHSVRGIDELEIDGALNHDGTTVGFYGVAPTTRQVLATGAGKTVDNVITALQTLGLVSQS